MPAAIFVPAGFDAHDLTDPHLRHVEMLGGDFDIRPPRVARWTGRFIAVRRVGQIIGRILTRIARAMTARAG
ncbi:hypothetical protein Aam_009_022 [Acidocella aminolytica 101 = DSM 11237]|uniref:Uncharacterized protein n=1 Tax=Acidocella aminolytica 101 = DSM 11237 TaxID=1120923 RepID=A0A0D6PD70_9PROT|nr:hypothetical protein Aam_009_022 [Acidocella aminolytica 101 = DSM 11237]